MKETRTSATVAVALLTAIAPIACQGHGERSRRVALLEPHWSEVSISSLLPESTIDLRNAASAERLRISGANVSSSADGLDLETTDGELRIAINGIHAVSGIDLTLRTRWRGVLRLAWKPAQRDVKWRTIGRRLRGPGGFADYQFDLSHVIAREPFGVEIELTFELFAEPDRRSGRTPALPDVTIERIALRSDVRVESESEQPVVGKAKIGRDTREAVAVPIGGTVVLPLPEGARSLELETGRRGGGPRSGRLRATIEPSGQVALDSDLGSESVASWHSHRVSVADSRRAERLRLEFEATGSGEDESWSDPWAGAALVANPAAIVSTFERRPDVILLSLDTVGAIEFEAALRAGLLPHFERLARRGLRFDRARSSSSVTSTAHAVLLTGRLPGSAGVLRAEMGALPGGGLADRLRAAGCSTTAHTGGILVTERLGHDRGFEVFTREDTLFGLARDATDVEALARRFASWMNDPAGGCRFLFLHSYEAHGPFLAPGSAESPELTTAYGLKNVAGRLPFTEDGLSGLLAVLDLATNAGSAVERADARATLARAREAHRGEIARLDRVLGPLLEQALDRPRPDGTVVVLTADHGESFFEHGRVEHSLLEESNLRVPLLIVGAGIEPEHDRETVARTIDVAPTIFDLLGLDRGAEIDGRSLVRTHGRERRSFRRSYAFTMNSGFAWEVEGRKWVTYTGFRNENLGIRWNGPLGVDPAPEDVGAHSEHILDTEQASFVRQVVDSMPGLHVDLAGLEGRSLVVDVSGIWIQRAAIHAWDVAALREFDVNRLSREIRAGQDAQLWFVDDAVSGQLRLVDGESASECRLVLRPGAAVDRSGSSCDPAVFGGLRIWRGRGAVADRSRELLDSEERRKLQALGYIQ